MKTGFLLGGGVVLVLVIGLGLVTQRTPDNVENSTLDSVNELIILELFTSQGCSSCPPAESVMSKIARDKRYSNLVVPLAFHVDYWDHLGWQDPFSSTEWTERQANYREAFGGASLYTPQIVIQGQHEMVGSDENGIKKTIDGLLGKGSSSPVDIIIEEFDVGDKRIILDISVVEKDTLSEQTLLLMSALYENIDVTQVKAGENAGRALSNNYVVRMLDIEPMLFDQDEEQKKFQVSLLLESDWQIDNLGIVSWIQGARTMKIYRVDTVRELANRN